MSQQTIEERMGEIRQRVKAGVNMEGKGLTLDGDVLGLMVRCEVCRGKGSLVRIDLMARRTQRAPKPDETCEPCSGSGEVLWELLDLHPSLLAAAQPAPQPEDPEADPPKLTMHQMVEELYRIHTEPLEDAIQVMDQDTHAEWLQDAKLADPEPKCRECGGTGAIQVPNAGSTMVSSLPCHMCSPKPERDPAASPPAEMPDYMDATGRYVTHEHHTDALEEAWGLIANAWGGDWDKAAPDWQEAAIRWRNNTWHKALDDRKHQWPTRVEIQPHPPTIAHTPFQTPSATAVRVSDLLPGDVTDTELLEAMVIATTPHPVHLGFTLVVWWIIRNDMPISIDSPERSEFTFDALSPGQVVMGMKQLDNQQRKNRWLAFIEEMRS